MGNKTIAELDRADPSAASRRRPLKALWKKVRGPLAETRAVKSALAGTIAMLLRGVKATNRLVPGSEDPATVIGAQQPAIVALWHGQHLLAPAYLPDELDVVALFSKSRDAELNALVAEKLGFGIVRGSGGRDGHVAEKGGARALIQMKRLLDQGRNVAMIADVPHGTPRQVGLGLITLARISGRPILPGAIATSRRKVLEKSWDKTAINLPFGKVAITFGDPISVPDGTDEEMEAMRREVTAALNATTARAYMLVGDAR
ncbi:MAG: lysophospholipid acyltransferase family protein [Aliihoeflea sp.]